MASVFSHAIAAAAIGTATVGGSFRMQLWTLGAMCSVVPDLDVVHFWFGIPYSHVLGHRGLSHSLFAAAVLACLVTRLVRWRWPASATAPRLFVLFFLTTASHGVLDAMTSGGLGVAFFAPFSATRHFLPWRPIVVSPLSIPEFFTEWGVRVMWSELLWVWLPSAAVALTALTLGRRGTEATSRTLPSRDPSRERTGSS
jgi:inner membrane protein